MADCTKAQIPQSIIDAKGRFKCDADFVPVPDDNGNVPDLIGVRGSGLAYGIGQIGSHVDNCGLEELGTKMGETFPLTSSSYSDELMEWKSEIFSIGDAQVAPPQIKVAIRYDKSCVGSCYPVIPTPDPTNPANKCRGEYFYYDDREYGDQPHNIYLHGKTVQFFFTIYKKYCCILNDKGEVTDYNYFYYFMISVVSGSTGFSVMLKGPIDFCQPLDIAPAPVAWIGVKA